MTGQEQVGSGTVGAAASGPPSDTARPPPRRRNPWRGLESYEEVHQGDFCGRDDEVDMLRRLLRRSRMTLLFGKSGLGKTSLLRAGLFPRERAADALPVYVRLDFDALDRRAGLGQQVKKAIADAAAKEEIEGPEVVEGESLWEYLHQADGQFWSRGHRLVLPLVVLDQFEEIFTLGRQKGRWPACKTFIEELSDLIEGRVPEALRRRIEENPDTASRFALGRHHYKFLVGLREDFMAELDRIREDLPPALFQNRYRLTPMDGNQGMEVVTKPGGGLVEPATAETIVRRVAGTSRRSQPARRWTFLGRARSGSDDESAGPEPLERLRVDPAILSLFCQQLDDRRVERRWYQRFARGWEPPSTITDALVERRGGEILLQFYQDSLRGLPGRWWSPRKAKKAHLYIQDELLSDGFRDNVPLKEASDALGAKAVDALIERRILRSDDRGERPRVELSHDVLIEQVELSNRRWARTGLRWVSVLSAVVLVMLMTLLGGGAYMAAQRTDFSDAYRSTQDSLGRATGSINAAIGFVSDSAVGAARDTLASFHWSYFDDCRAETHWDDLEARTMGLMCDNGRMLVKLYELAELRVTWVEEAIALNRATRLIDTRFETVRNSITRNNGRIRAMCDSIGASCSRDGAGS